MHLYIVRHGEAVCNVNPIIGGFKGDTGLTERGVKQAESLRDRLASTDDYPTDILISSTLPRAKQTAEIIAPALDLPIVWDDDLQEIRVGEADGLSHKEAHKQFSCFGSSDLGPFVPLAPGGESWAEFMLRVSRTLHRITNQYPNMRVMLVSHGGVIDGSFAYFLSIHTRGAQRQRLEFYPRNTSITHWEEYNYRNNRLWRLACYNDKEHLRFIGSKESPRWANVDTVEEEG